MGGDREKNKLKFDHFFPDPKEINPICPTLSSNQEVRIQHAALYSHSEKRQCPSFSYFFPLLLLSCLLLIKSW